MREIDKLKESSVDQTTLKQFLNHIPDRLTEHWDLVQNEEDQKVRKHLSDLLDNLDYIDFHYRRYLLGYHKTLHRVFYEFRRLIKLGEFWQGFSLILQIGETCQDNEFYEVLTKHEKAKKKILNLCKKTTL